MPTYTVFLQLSVEVEAEGSSPKEAALEARTFIQTMLPHVGWKLLSLGFSPDDEYLVRLNRELVARFHDHDLSPR